MDTITYQLMPRTCTYHCVTEAPGTPATHNVYGSGQCADWKPKVVVAVPGAFMQPEFCGPCAELVAALRNTSWRAAVEARALRPPTPRVRAVCKVCGNPLDGTGQQVEGVGMVCETCAVVAESELLADPRSATPTRRRGRRKAVAGVMV